MKLKLPLLLSTLALIGINYPIEGTYTAQEWNSYELTLNADSTFLLQDRHFEWDITRYSTGVWKLSHDTIVCVESKKWHLTTIEVDTSSDYLGTIKLIQDANGNLITHAFSGDASPRINPEERRMTEFIKKKN